MKCEKCGNEVPVFGCHKCGTGDFRNWREGVYRSPRKQKTWRTVITKPLPKIRRNQREGDYV